MQKIIFSMLIALHVPSPLNLLAHMVSLLCQVTVVRRFTNSGKISPSKTHSTKIQEKLHTQCGVDTYYCNRSK